MRSKEEINKAKQIINDNANLSYSYREDIVAVLDWMLGGDQFDGLGGD